MSKLLDDAIFYIECSVARIETGDYIDALDILSKSEEILSIAKIKLQRIIELKGFDAEANKILDKKKETRDS